MPDKGENMGKTKVRTIIIIVVAAMLAAGYYFYLSNKTPKEKEETQITAVQNILLKDLDTDYPPTPKEVVKLFSEISKCLLNEEYSDEQLEGMADQLLKIYDEELCLENPRDQYIKSLTSYVNDAKENGYAISTYTPSNSTDVEFFRKDGRECAKLYCTFTIRTGANYSSTRQVFVLRKETGTNHWKILGFDTENVQK